MDATSLTWATTVAAVASAIAACGSLTVAWIQAKTMRYRSYNEAAVIYRTRFVGVQEELMRESGEEPGRDVRKILSADVVQNQKIAKLSFQPYVPKDELAGFNEAWRIYERQEWLASFGKPGQKTNRAEDVAAALKQIDRLLWFAREK